MRPLKVWIRLCLWTRNTRSQEGPAGVWNFTCLRTGRDSWQMFIVKRKFQFSVSQAFTRNQSLKFLSFYSWRHMHEILCFISSGFILDWKPFTLGNCSLSLLVHILVSINCSHGNAGHILIFNVLLETTSCSFLGSLYSVSLGKSCFMSL